MTRSLLLASLLSLALTGVALAKPELDPAGKCRDNGKFVAARLCATVQPGKCRDIKTKKFARCGGAGTEPVPAK